MSFVYLNGSRNKGENVALLMLKLIRVIRNTVVPDHSNNNKDNHSRDIDHNSYTSINSIVNLASSPDLSG